MKVANTGSDLSSSHSATEDLEATVLTEKAESLFNDHFASPFADYRLVLKMAPSQERDNCLVACAEQQWSLDDADSQLVALNIASKVDAPITRNDWYSEKALQLWILGNKDRARAIVARMTLAPSSTFDEWLKKSIGKDAP